MLRILLLVMLFTTATEVSMPNPAMEHPGKFESFAQMMRYFRGLDRHGLRGHMVAVEIGKNGEMYFEREGKRCRM